MSTDPGAGAGGFGPGGPAGPGGQPSEAELRAAYEAELARITSSDMMLQAAVSLLNIASYRLLPRPAPGAEGATAGAAAGAGGGQDLEQVRDSIDGVRALVEILERRVPNELGPLREALSQLQMAYARELQAAGGAAPGGQGATGGQGGGEPDADADDEPGQGGGGGQAPPGGSSGGAPGGTGGGHPVPGPSEERGKPGPGPAESSGRLWVPGR